MLQKIYDFLFSSEFPGTGNTYGRIALLFAAVLAGLVIGRIARAILERTGEKLKARPRARLLGLFLVCAAKPAFVLLFALGISSGFDVLSMSPTSHAISGRISQALFAIGISYLIYRLVDIIDDYLSRLAADSSNKLDDMLVPMVRKTLRVVIIVLAGLFLLENFYSGRVGTLLASLGIGGLAVALAAQDTLKNFFGSIMIMFDKPFRVGDRVVVDGFDGPVEKVGFRSTKIRTLDGHLVTVPNDRVAANSVQNIGARPSIRRLTTITITYDTPPEKVQRAVDILKELLDNHEGMQPDFPPRVFFNDFGAASLDILMIYWYFPPDYWTYLAFSEKLNHDILRRFNDEGIEFAFPTQTIYLANDDKRQLALRLLRENAEEQGRGGPVAPPSP